jgi:hypothetical protein
MANSAWNMYCFKDFIKWQVLKTLLSVLSIITPSSILILSTNLRLDIPSCLFPYIFHFFLPNIPI